MNDKPLFASASSFVIVAAAALGSAIAVSLLSAVVMLFQSRGTPLEPLATAERACAQHVYRSEREACITEWLAPSRATSVAKR